MAPTANPYASSFFAAAGAAPSAAPEPYPAERLSAPAGNGMAERRALSLPPLPPLRTSSKSPGGPGVHAWAGVCAGQQPPPPRHATVLDLALPCRPGPPPPVDSGEEESHPQQLLGGTAVQRLS